MYPSMIDMYCKAETKVDMLEEFEEEALFQNACMCPLSSCLSTGYEMQHFVELEEEIFEEPSAEVIKKFKLTEEDMLNISMRAVACNASNKTSQINIISFWPIIDRIAMQRVGMKGVVFLRAKDISLAKKLMDEFDEDIRMGIYVDPLLDGDELVNQVSDLAGKYRLPILIKLYDDLEKTGKLDSLYGMSPTRYVESVGLLDRECFIYGCIHADKDDFETWSIYSATAVISPTTFLNTGLGIANIHAMQSSGVNVRLASYLENNILNEIKLSVLLTRGLLSDPSLLIREEAERLAYADNAGCIYKVNFEKYDEACKKIIEKIKREV